MKVNSGHYCSDNDAHTSHLDVNVGIQKAPIWSLINQQQFIIFRNKLTIEQYWVPMRRELVEGDILAVVDPEFLSITNYVIGFDGPMRSLNTLK